MARALGPPEDREDAIVGMPEDRILRTLTEVRLDLSTREKEFEHLCFPCEKLFDTFEWQNGYLQHWKFDPGKTELFMRFQAEILQRFQSYQIPLIQVEKGCLKGGRLPCVRKGQHWWRRSQRLRTSHSNVRC